MRFYCLLLIFCLFLVPSTFAITVTVPTVNPEVNPELNPELNPEVKPDTHPSCPFWSKNYYGENGHYVSWLDSPNNQTECNRNPGWMLDNCATSCQAHSDRLLTMAGVELPSVNADNHELCAFWSEHYDTGNGQYVSWRNSPDKQTECSRNPGWMLENCASSCQAQLKRLLVIDPVELARPQPDNHEACPFWSQHYYAENGQYVSWQDSPDQQTECDRNPGWMLENCAASCQAQDEQREMGMSNTDTVSMSPYPFNKYDLRPDPGMCTGGNQNILCGPGKETADRSVCKGDISEDDVNTLSVKYSTTAAALRACAEDAMCQGVTKAAWVDGEPETDPPGYNQSYYMHGPEEIDQSNRDNTHGNHRCFYYKNSPRRANSQAWSRPDCGNLNQNACLVGTKKSCTLWFGICLRERHEPIYSCNEDRLLLDDAAKCVATLPLGGFGQKPLSSTDSQCYAPFVMNSDSNIKRCACPEGQMLGDGQRCIPKEENSDVRFIRPDNTYFERVSVKSTSRFKAVEQARVLDGPATLSDPSKQALMNYKDGTCYTGVLLLPGGGTESAVPTDSPTVITYPLNGSNNIGSHFYCPMVELKPGAALPPPEAHQNRRVPLGTSDNHFPAHLGILAGPPVFDSTFTEDDVDFLRKNIMVDEDFSEWPMGIAIGFNVKKVDDNTFLLDYGSRSLNRGNFIFNGKSGISISVCNVDPKRCYPTKKYVDIIERALRNAFPTEEESKGL